MSKQKCGGNRNPVLLKLSDRVADTCRINGVDYIFGLAGNSVLHGLAYEVADDLKVCRAEAGADRMRGFGLAQMLSG